ncbi:MAG: hypothetical protein K1X91_16270 [Bacteriodetes bacterium]|nr:hypothetical protein [Bacteroidota bacterium]
MKRTRLNLDVLRSNTSFASTTNQQQDITSSEFTNPTEEFKFSRRSLLKFSSAALLASVPVLRKTSAFMVGPFEIDCDGKRLAVSFAGEERWVVETSMYSGKPVIDIVQSEQEITIALRNARFAGTNLDADFVAQIKNGLSGWTMKHSMKSTGHEASVQFERWLMGFDGLRGKTSLNEVLCTPDTEHSCTVAGKVTVEYFPNNSLAITGKNCCSFDGLHISSDGVLLRPGSTVQLESAENKKQTSLLKNSYSKRTTLLLERNSKTWDIALNNQPNTHWNITHDVNVFDTCIVECAESNYGSTEYAALFEQSERENSTAMVQPIDVDNHHGEFYLPLRNMKYGIAFTPDVKRTSLIARFGESPVWLHRNNMSLQLADHPDAPPFELHAENGIQKRISCKPTIVTIQPHLGDAIVTPHKFEAYTPIVFAGFGAVGVGDGFKKSVSVSPSAVGGIKDIDEVVVTKASSKKGYQLAKIGDKYIDVKVSVELPSISIIRPYDLLILKFYYQNLQISGSGDDSFFSPVNSSSDSYIVVEFQPQNIIEEAFYEVEPTVTGTDSPSASSKIPSGAGNEPIPQPPIKARISGNSRLAFKTPKGIRIPLALARYDDAKKDYFGLLCWDTWEPSLVPVAQWKDKSSTGLYIYPGLISYLDKQGIKFKSGALMDNASIGSKWVDPSDFTAVMNDTSANALKTQGIKINNSYSGIGTLTTSKVSKRGSSKVKASGASTSIGSIKYTDMVTNYSGMFAALMRPKIKKPDDIETAIELPYRLYISPLIDGGWTHTKKVKSRLFKLNISDGSGGTKTESINFTELWHTRLWFRQKDSKGKYSVNERDGNYLLGNVPKVRAIWSPDYKGDANTDKPTTSFPPWNHTSLTSADRWALVINSSDYYTKTTKNSKDVTYEPKAIDANKLFLSSIGGWVDVHGAWDPVPSQVDLVDWIHKGTMGRDHYVRVMYRGYLFPFGHKCTLVKITERKFAKPSQRGTYGAYLKQRMFVIVRQPDMALDDTNTLFEYKGREVPFKSVHIKTVITPNIDDPNGATSKIPSSGNSGYGYPNEFYIQVGSKDYLFHCTGTDWDGNKIDFVIPMGFVLGSISNFAPYTEALRITDYFNAGSAPSSRTTIDLGGARVAFGPSKNKGDTSFETKSMTFSVGYPTPTLPKDVTWFFPKLKTADIRHQDVERMTGNTAQPSISLHQKFLEEGFDAAKNAGEVLLQFASQVPISFGGSAGGSSDKSGGFVSPNQAISGLSRAIGPISGKAGDITGALDKFTGGSFTFDPKDFLGALDAKIFGVISLFDIIQLITGSDPRTTLLPQLLSQVVPNLGTDPSALLNNLQNEVYNKIKSAYDTAYAQATAEASSILAKLEEMKALIDGLKDQIDALATAISSSSDFGDIYTVLTTQLPEFLNWITTNIGPLGIIPSDALETIQEVSKFLENLQDGIRVGFDWKPKMQGDPYGFFVPADPNDTFVLSAYAKLPFKNGEFGDPEAKVEGYLQNFTINLIPPIMDLIAIPIIKMGFSAELGKKADIFCNLGELQFKGPLEFVNTLQKYIPMDGFIDPPAIDVDTSGIKISFDIGIPDLAIGLFAVTNISLGAALQLPFLGDSMTFKFEFCKKDSPFHMTYCCLGGGGYFGLTLSLDGVDKIEAAFEIGAELAVNFGVASGSVSIFAGVYFCMEGDTLTLTGYVRIHGEVDVLGLISASITLEMTLTYISTGKLYGTATLTIEISVFIFSGSVEISVEKYFKGSAGDPVITQLMPWEDYPNSDLYFDDHNKRKYFELYVGAFA